MEDDSREPRARAFMTRRTVCARETDTVRELCERLRGEQITCVPVIDEANRVHGVVSLTDLLAPVGSANGVSDFHTSPAMDNMASVHRFLTPKPSALDRPVSAFMARDWTSIRPDAPIAEVAAVLLTHKIHRVLVTEQGRLVGLISVTDVLAAIAGRQPAANCGTA